MSDLLPALLSLLDVAYTKQDYVLSALVHTVGSHARFGEHLFFFFQAEDGIRDSSVTGVQTCALPISLAVAHGLAVGITEPLFLLMSVPVLLITLTIALVLVARGRIGRPNQGAIGLFLVMGALLDLTTSLYAILDAAGLPTGILKQPYSLPGI